MAKTIKITKGATWEQVGKSANTSKIEDALTKVGLNFDVEKRGIYFGPDMKGIKDKYATVRTDKEVALGIVGPGYQICPNAVAFAFADYIDSKLKFTRGGMTYTGLCWVVGEMPAIKILGEDYVPCVVLQNSFNGKYQLRASIVALNRATGSQVNIPMDGIASSIKVKHLRSLPSKMKQGQDTLVGVRKYMDGLRKVAERYANVKMDKEQIEMFLSILFPIREKMNETAKANVLRNRKAFLACYDDAGNKKHWGNAWGVILAYANYVTHTITKNTKTAPERKFMATSIGKGFGGFLKKLEGVTGKKIA